MRSARRFGSSFRVLRLTLVALALGAGAAVAQENRTIADTPNRITFAVNEGAAGNLDYMDILFRYEELGELLQKVLGAPVIIVSVRNRDRLQENLKRRAYKLLLSRPNDVPAQAVRDFGYHPVATAKDPYHTVFIVPKGSTLRSLADVKGKSIVTPDQYSNMWRAANAMLRDVKIDMSREKLRSMRDQEAIGWSLESGFYDVGVVNSASGVARNWEKNGGRVLAKSRDQINMPFIASPELSDAQIAKVRAAILGLGSSDSGRAILKKINLPNGFRDTPREEFVELLNWMGEEVKRPADGLALAD